MVVGVGGIVNSIEKPKKSLKTENAREGGPLSVGYPEVESSGVE